jgi:uncharacterized protein YbjT (DUF2867 family)
MIAIMGASGHTGRDVAEILLKDGEKVRVIGRARDRLQPLIDRGADAAVGDAADAAFLSEAFRGSSGVYTLLPPDSHHPDYPAYQTKVGEAMASAVRDSGVDHVVLLSSVGADRPSGTGPIAGLHEHEQRLRAVPGLNTLFLRAGYFFENHLLSLGLIKHQGVNGSAMAGDLPIAMAATADISREAARALRARDFTGATVREILGPRDYTLEETTSILGKAIGRPDLAYVQFPYEAAFDGMVTMGMSKSMASLYVEMSRGFNEGRIRSVEGRNLRNTTPTRFEDFAVNILAPAYRAM